LDAKGFRLLTRAAVLLNNKRLIDQFTGEIAVCVCGNFVTLPSEVDTVLGIQVDGDPTIIRNEWFTYHINGTGDEGWTPPNFADILGSNFCTFRDPDRPVRIAARIRNASDANKKVRMFGWDANGERIYSLDAAGQKVDGWWVPTPWNKVQWNSAVNPVVKIDYGFKEQTTDFVDLYAVDPDTGEAISKLASWRPDETTPRYIRIRVDSENVVRVKFRRRDIRITTTEDYINCDHEEAFLLAVRAVAKRDDDKLTEARAYEEEAARLIKEQADKRRPGGIAPLQVIDQTVGGCNHGMFY
jgi:hypothetical protein